ncbi:ferrous iron transporter B [Olsenella sp. YH-ols2217]|uniref:Ferrous iron transporter B n=1 Tax=Kribbibacterium absianum TaxID=3044210 RepID=A0ABT6ZK49_9ACTN|nr:MULTISPECIES: ferrous iron transporter B [unclassified Olsenella]MDJ1122606.1 ferrous iron transporter B [Olsenella sp. YH-ols2216]MDJ1129434.1 ferrous iron transporter B [Olsenella sp. YH-ols2217]
MAITIALAGNPNCGKTTLFNQLTGSNGYVGNWPGVTVEKLEAPWRKNKDVVITDLPGIYSLSPYSPEEVVSRDHLVKDRPSAVIDLVDVTNLERNLYLTTQVLECGLPTVVGLNMCDLLEKSGDQLDVDALSSELGCPVVKGSALRSQGLDQLMGTAESLATTGRTGRAPRVFSPRVEKAIQETADVLKPHLSAGQPERWFAIKAFEGDEKALDTLGLPAASLAAIGTIRAGVEAELDDDAESIITTERYDWIEGVMRRCVVKAPKALTTSEKIDRVVTNRILGLPIFVCVMVLVYYLAVSTVGTWGTDWANDGLFGDGWFLSPAAAQSYEEAQGAYDDEDYGTVVDEYLAAADAAGVDTDGVAEAIESGDAARVQAFAEAASAAGVTVPDAPLHDADGNFLDSEGNVVLTDAEDDPLLSDGQTLAYHDTIDAEAFLAAANAEEPIPGEYGVYVPGVPVVVEGWLDDAGASELVKSLVLDGIVGGVGSILGFVPQMIVLFLLLCFLEDCGYMSRVAFVMDRAFRRFGLSGKSFIPLLVSSGCGVPGIMATKTIENDRDRRMTVMLTTMIPCGAKTPIIALLMGVLIGGTEGWWIAPFFYFLGLAAVIVSAIMLKKTKPFAGEPAPFVMELPAYHLPALKSYLLHVWERVWAFIRKAGTIIFVACVGVWFLSNFGVAGWDSGSGAFGFLPEMADAPENYMNWSMLAGVGNAIAWIFAPLGFGTWQAAACSLSALIAKENLVSTFGVLFGLGEVGEGSALLWATFAQMFTVGGTLSLGAMLAFVAFNMLDAPCFAAIGTIRRQMADTKWFWAAIAYQCGFGWVVGLIINQLWELFALGNFGFWTVVAILCLAGIIIQLFRPMPRATEKPARQEA